MKYSDLMRKGASARSEFFTDYGHGSMGNMQAGSNGQVNQIGQAVAGASGVGELYGMGSGPATEEEELEWDKTPEKALIPGVASARLERRMKRQLQDDSGGTPHYWSQKFSPGIQALAMMLAGAGIGASVGGPAFIRDAFKEDPNSRFNTDPFFTRGRQPDNSGQIAGNISSRVVGGLLGAFGGLGAYGISHLLASLLAASKRTRTKEEQKAYANSGTAAEWLVPGVSTYNRWKTLGRAFADSDERLAKLNQTQTV